jgi:hypothetical protein
MRKGDVDERCAGDAERVESGVERRPHGVVHAFRHERARNADAETSDVPCQHRREIGNRLVARCRVRWVWPGDDRERQRRVADGARNRAYLIQRGCERKQTVARHASVRRLQADHAAERRRLPD